MFPFPGLATWRISVNLVRDAARKDAPTLSWRRGEHFRPMHQGRLAFPASHCPMPSSNPARSGHAVGQPLDQRDDGPGIAPHRPRELPTELRSRPGIGTAYQFLDQPYKLALGIEILLRCTARNTSPALLSTPRPRRWIPPFKSIACGAGSLRSKSWFPPRCN